MFTVTVSVSHLCYSHLKDHPNWVFEVRGPVNFKNVAKPVMCYWLIENVERSMQEKPTLEDPLEMSLFTELITNPRERQDSLIVDCEDNDNVHYYDPLIKDDIEKLGRLRCDSTASGPHVYAPRSPLASRHVSHDLLMSSMYSMHSRSFDESPARSHSISDMSRPMSPFRTHWVETIQEEELPQKGHSTPNRSYSMNVAGQLNVTHAVHKISTESNSSTDSDLTVTPHKSSTGSNTSEQSGEGDSGYDPHEPETAPTSQPLRRTGLDAVTMPESWVKLTRERFERMAGEKKKKESEMEAFERTKGLRGRSMSHSHSCESKLSTSARLPLRISTSFGCQTDTTNL